jgi:mannose-6-phosphate isomerase-like protein (cupin superfamily)
MGDLDVTLLGEVCDLVATDSSELTVLARTGRASMAHAMLPVGATSIAVVHRTVDEIWFIVAGTAQVWRCNAGEESVETVASGASFAIPCGTKFQYRTVGDEPFRFVMATIPAWPGDGEAVQVEGVWPPLAG